MSQILSSCKLVEEYRGWVIANSQHLDGIENISRVAIYLTVGEQLHSSEDFKAHKDY